MSLQSPSRRKVLVGTAAAGGGLLIGLQWPAAQAQAGLPGAAFAPNAWVRIGRDGGITLICHKTEMGQGIFTAIPMVLAEELEVPLSAVTVEMAPVDSVYGRTRGNLMITSNSESIRDNYTKLRKAGAAAREMLVAAAARRWSVDPGSCAAAEGQVVHAASGRRFRFAELVDDAARLPVPSDPPLKDPATFKIIGTPAPRVDTPAKVTGRAVFGIDVQVPGMLVALVAKPPSLGARLVSHDAAPARAVPGVRAVVLIESGVAVVADDFWSAKKGREALRVEWDESANARLSSASIATVYEALAREPGKLARQVGDVAAAESKATRKVEAVYDAPYLAHATMEPMNCTAHVRADACDVWVPTQTQTRTQEAASRACGLPLEKVRVHTTFVGGGFGRRLETDYTRDAVEVSQRIGAPVKVIWTREDDMRNDVYRPATLHRLSAALDEQGRLTAWRARVVSPSILQRFRPPADGIDSTSVNGIARPPYDIANAHIELQWRETGVPVGFWRSVGPSQNVFSTEAFVDEVAAAAGQDPYRFRRAMLDGNPRLRAVLDVAAAAAQWDTPPAPNVFRGIACFEYESSCWIAQVVEIEADAQGALRVRRIVGALDAGTVVNPDTVKAQMEGGILFGLSAATQERISVAAGRIEQSNFHDYPVLRINEAPHVEVHIVPSREAPGRVGETSVPAVAPALANAVFAATGRRVRSLPIRLGELRRA